MSNRICPINKDVIIPPAVEIVVCHHVFQEDALAGWTAVSLNKNGGRYATCPVCRARYQLSDVIAFVEPWPQSIQKLLAIGKLSTEYLTFVYKLIVLKAPTYGRIAKDIAMRTIITVLSKLYEFAAKLKNDENIQRIFAMIRIKLERSRSYILSPQFKSDLEMAKTDFQATSKAYKNATAILTLSSAAVFLNSSRKTKALLFAFAATTAIHKLGAAEEAGVERKARFESGATLTPTVVCTEPLRSLAPNKTDLAVRRSLGFH